MWAQELLWNCRGCAGPPNTRGQYNLSPSCAFLTSLGTGHLPAWDEEMRLFSPMLMGIQGSNGSLLQKRSYDQATGIPRHSVKGLDMESGGD